MSGQTEIDARRSWRGVIFAGFLSALPAAVFCLILIAIGAAQSRVFLSTFNLGNLVVQITPFLLVSLGQMYAVGSGGLDLSTGSVISLVAVVTASSFEILGIPGAVALGLLAGLSAGLLNGLLIRQGIEPFLVTLASLLAIQGLALLISPVPGGKVPFAFTQIAGYWGAMPVALPLLAILVLLAAWLLARTKTGTHLAAVGANEEVARLCGVNVRRSILHAYLLSALFAALAGLFMVARTSTGDPTVGARFTLDSLAAVVLGGTLLGGGRIMVSGTVFGAIALGLLSNVLNLLQVPAFYQAPLKGLLIVGAVLMPNVVAQMVAHSRARAAAGPKNREAAT